MTQLSATGESRVRGYLYVLERSMRAAVSGQLASDAVREVESHIRERVAESDGTPNERDALEAILTRLGSPTAVARAYSLEMVMEEAAVGGRLLPVCVRCCTPRLPACAASWSRSASSVDTWSERRLSRSRH